MKLFFPLLISLLMLIIFLPISSASIEIATQLDEVYNLGDKIDFSFRIIPNTTANALVKLTLKCSEKELLYYTAPIELEKGKDIKVDALPIKAFSEGACNVRADVIMANVKSWEGENLEGLTSKNFTISHLLELSVSVDKTDVLPGDKIKIMGNANKKGDAIKNMSIVIGLDNERLDNERLDNEKEQIRLDGKEFSYALELDRNIKSGEHIITISVNDSYGNFNKKGVVINVKAIPAKLGFKLNKREFKPKENLQLGIYLSDQANDSIKGDVNIKLLKEKTLFKDEIVIFDFQKEANKEFEFTFNYTTLPHDYTLRSTFGNLEKEETIRILPYQRIEMGLEGDAVFIKNVGNVRYNNKTRIVLEKEDKTYLLDKEIDLDVGEETKINLSKEVPSGIYTITLPPETVVEERVVEKRVERIVEKEVPKYIENKKEDGVVEAKEREEPANLMKNVIKNIEIEDNRPFYKKGLSFITGGVVVGAGLLLSRPRLASFAMIIILLSTVGYFNRRRIERIIEKVKKRRERF